MLGVTPDAIRVWARRGLIPVTRIGAGKLKRLRFRRADIEAFIEKGEST